MAKVDFKKVAYPTIFGSATRKPQEVAHDEKSIKEMESVGETLITYAPKEGYTYQFPSFEDAKIVKQPINKSENSPVQYLIGCMSSADGENFQPDWFSVNHLAKRDAKNNPVHPTWYALGNLYQRILALCKMGEIKTGKAIQVATPVFEGGQPKRIPARDLNGNIKFDAEGNTLYEVVTRPQTCYELTPAVAAE